MATSCIAEQAAELVTSDPDLLRQEFEAIVAANYPWSAAHELRLPPPVRCPVSTRVEPPNDHPEPPTSTNRTFRTTHRRPRPRERSPPVRTAPLSTVLWKEAMSTGSRPDSSSPRRERATPTCPCPSAPSRFLGGIRPPGVTASAPRGAFLG